MSSPLLVGPPPDYGAFRAYLDSDTSSQVTTEADSVDRCPDWAGHVFVLLVFLSIMYGFWTIIVAPDSRPGFFE